VTNWDYEGKDGLLYSKPSSSGPVCKASQSGVSGKSYQRRGGHSTNQPALGPAKPSRVSKVARNKRRLLDERQSRVHYAVPLPGNHADDGLRGQSPPTVSARRSPRISTQTPQPTKEHSNGHEPRRSVRISERVKRLAESHPDVLPAQPNTTAEQKLRRRTTTHANAACSTKPQGISKVTSEKARRNQRRNG